MEYEELVNLVKKHGELEQEILKNLPDDCMECRCDGDTFDYIHYGNHFDEMMRVCLKCGGMREGI